MKKFFAIIALSLLMSSKLFADHCGHDTDDSWKYTTSKSYASWTFKNTTDKSIVITHIGLYSKSDKIMADVKKDIYLKPFGVAYGKIYVGDLHTNFSSPTRWFCSQFMTRPKKFKLQRTRNSPGLQA